MKQRVSARRGGSADRGVAVLRLTVAGGLAMFAYAAAAQAPANCLPLIGEEFGLNHAGEGLTVALRWAPLLLSLLGAGHFAGRFGKAPFLVAGLALMAVGIAATALSAGYGMLLIAQGVFCAGAGMFEALVNPLAAELRPEDPARALNLVHALNPIGLTTAAVLSGELLERGAPWRATVAIWLPLALVGCALYATRRYPRPAAAHGSGASGDLAFLRRGTFWALALAMPMAGASAAGALSWAPTFLAEEMGASARGGTMAVAFYGLFMAAGRFVAVAIVKRVGSIPMTVVSAALCALATLGLARSQTPHSAWLCSGLAGLTIACCWPTLLAIATETLETTSTPMFVLLETFGIVGCGVSPLALGVLGDAYGIRSGLLLLPVASGTLAAVLVAVGAAQARRRKRAESGPVERAA